MSHELEYRPRCPTCDMLVGLNGDMRFAPFCCERCRLIDLGRWLGEEHRIPCEDAEDAEGGETSESSGAAAPRLPPGWHDA